MKVLKFGGTSVGTIASLQNVKAIVEGISGPAIVVVSALGGLTDRLIATANSAARKETTFREAMTEFRKRHFDIIEALVPCERKAATLSAVSDLLNQLEDTYYGISQIGDLPERSLNLVVSFGERMSSIIVAAMLQNATHHDSTKIFKTEKWFNKNIADRPLTNNLIREEFEPEVVGHHVMGGFISTDRDSGEITNLGRGGSDYTAALIAAALDADLLEIWTDVDGFMTADPRIIPQAQVMKEISFIESMELCSFGAKVVYPPTIYPVFHKNIPIKILNTFNPTAPGTLISDNIPSRAEPRGISSLNNTAMITLRGPLTANVPAINSRAYNAMARIGVSIFLVAQPNREEEAFSLTMPDADAERALVALRLEFAPELQNGNLTDISLESSLSVVAVVGEGIRMAKGLGARLTNTLQRNSIHVKAVSDGISDTTIAILVDGQDVKSALKLVHAICFE